MKKNYVKPLICSVMTCSMLLSCFGNLNIYATSDYKNEEILNSNYLNKTEDLDSTLKNQEVESNTSERPLYGFENIDGNWYYYDVTTGELQTGFITVPIEGVNRTFYANANGILQVGLIEIDSNKYYFDPEKGYSVTGFVKLNPEYSNGLDQSSYFDENGHMVFGEQIINGTKYLFDENGAMVTGNLISTYAENGENQISYLDVDGNPVHGQQFIDGNWYYFNENGVAVTGFKDLSAEENFGTAKTVYYDVDGQMVHGEKQIDGAIYYFDPDTGALTTGFQSVEAAYSLSGTDKMSFYEDSGQLFVGERMFQDIYFKTDANGNIISTQLNGVPYFNQRDPRWLYTYIGGYSFGSSGCVPTTATMIINFFKGTTFNPVDVGTLLYNQGYFNGSGMGTSSDCWSFISSYYGLGYRNNLGYEGIIQALKDGMMVAGAVGYGTWCPWWGITHEVLMFGIDEAGYTTVYDPYELSRCGKFHVSDVFNQRSTDPFDNLNGGPFFALGYDQYFGVSKNDFNGSFDVKVKIGDGASHNITTKVWTDQNGQDDLKEYTNNLESGYYIAKINVKDHNNEYGKYYIETYVDGRLYRSKNIILYNSSQETTIENVGNTDTNFRVTTNVINVPAELVEIRHAIWSETNGQDDLRWITGTRNGDSWITDYTTFSNSGAYDAHVYAYMNDGSLISLGAYSFEVSEPSWNIEIENQNEEAGTFDVVIRDIESASGVSQIQVPVWCEEDQNDIYWYTAERQSNGSYKVTVSTANHKYHAGEYKIHTYLTAGNGIRAFKEGPRGTMEAVHAKVEAKDATGEQKTYRVTVNNAGVFGDLSNVQFVIWSEANGQDDIKWINGSAGANGSWSLDVAMNQFSTYGSYNAHAYGTLRNGSTVFLGETTFEVDEPSWNIEIENQDEEAGTFDVVIRDIESASGVSQIQVPVWCEEDQNDIYWYTAERQSDGSYRVTVNIKNHQNHTGEYKIHVYLYDGNGFFRSRACENVEI